MYPALSLSEGVRQLSFILISLFWMPGMIVSLDTVMAVDLYTPSALKELLPRRGSMELRAVLELHRPEFDSWPLLVLIG